MTSLKEAVHGGARGSPMLDNEWGYSCRLVDLVGRLL
jgi:glyceraldehyde-3-phosphate dehydrogenase/erythrose-4-phosphate dehydrogenase